MEVRTEQSQSLTLKGTGILQVRIICRLLLSSLNHGFGAVHTVQATSASLEHLCNLEVENAVCVFREVPICQSRLHESVLFWLGWEEKTRLTSATDIKNHVVLLGVKPLDNLCCQLGDEGGCGLIGLFISLDLSVAYLRQKSFLP